MIIRKMITTTQLSQFSISEWSLKIIILFLTFSQVQTSFGDNLAHFQGCLGLCMKHNCSSDDKLNQFYEQQPIHLKIFLWTCEEECKHLCQWDTILFLLDDIGIELNQIPQFYGKWTFYRILGIQEPASAFFSLCNLITTYLAWSRYCRSVIKLVPAKEASISKWTQSAHTIDPHFTVISINAILAMNAWIWSTVFHIRETYLTEKMDYFSAFSVVLFSFYSIVVRSIDDKLDKSMDKLKLKVILFMPFLSYYLYHIHYLLFINFDYSFNMKANLVAGFSTMCLWLFWAYERLRLIPLDQWKNHHAMLCVLSVVLVKILLLFELNDFAPLFFILDAHSIWHWGTIGVTYLWFRFFEREAVVQSKRLKMD